MISPFRRAFFWSSDRLHQVANSIFWRVAGGDRRPVFFDARETYPELLRIDENFDVISEELEALLASRVKIPKYHEVDGAQRSVSLDREDGAWRAFFLQTHWAGDELPTRHRCPRTVAVVDSIPGALAAFFSILEARTPVPTHSGPSLHYLRYHTAFRVPRENPPTIRVKDRYYTWKERESLLFDDSWEHEVTNESDGVRVVLIVDVLRPLPFPLNAFNRFLMWMRTPRWRQRELMLERVGVGEPTALEQGGRV